MAAASDGDDGHDENDDDGSGVGVWGQAEAILFAQDENEVVPQ